jgi:hypothetical protein
VIGELTFRARLTCRQAVAHGIGKNGTLDRKSLLNCGQAMMIIDNNGDFPGQPNLQYELGNQKGDCRLKIRLQNPI